MVLLAAIAGGLTIASGQADWFGVAVLILSLLVAFALILLWMIWSFLGSDPAPMQASTWVLPGTAIATFTMLGLQATTSDDFGPARAIGAGWLDMCLVVVLAAPLVTLYFVPWMLKPYRWSDLWDTSMPSAVRREVVLEVVKAVVPLGGLVPPRALVEASGRTSERMPERRR